MRKTTFFKVTHKSNYLL